MSSKRYTDEFKVEAIKQVTERGFPVAEVALRLGVSQHSLYVWLKDYGRPVEVRREQQGQAAEMRRLKAELKRVTEGARHPKKGRGVLCQGVPVRYAFIKSEEERHSVRRLCQMMAVHPSGYYAWRCEPQSERNKSDQRLMGLIKQSWLESGGVYGYRKITMDLRDLGECCGKHRVYRLM